MKWMSRPSRTPTCWMSRQPTQETLHHFVQLLADAVLCWLFEDHLQSGVVLPQWCAPMTLHQYQNRAFEQPRSVLEELVHPDKYTRTRRPGIGA